MISESATGHRTHFLPLARTVDELVVQRIKPSTTLHQSTRSDAWETLTVVPILSPTTTLLKTGIDLA